MSCCANTYQLGCLDSCKVVQLPFNYTQTGVHEFYFDGVSNVKIKINGTIGQPVFIDLRKLNENSGYSLHIVNPDGTKFTYSNNSKTYDCFSFKTEIYKTIVIETITDECTIYYVECDYWDDDYSE